MRYTLKVKKYPESSLSLDKPEPTFEDCTFEAATEKEAIKLAREHWGSFLFDEGYYNHSLIGLYEEGGREIKLCADE